MLKVLFGLSLIILTSTYSFSQEINMRGKNVNITDGDITPSTSDDTDFGRQLSSAGSVTKTFTIQNLGASNLTLGTITIGGTNAAEFSYTSPSATVAAGASTTFTITFNPATAASGTRSATFSIVTNDADENPYNFSLQGTAFASNTVRWVNNQGASRPATVIVDGITYNTAATTYTDIASAITAATTDDIVYISNGVYRNTAETTSTDCDFFGQLQDATLYIQVSKTITITSETGNYCSSSARLVGYSFNIHTANNITIQGLTMDSVRLNGFWNSNCCAFPPSANVKIKNNKILNTRGHGIKTDSPGDGTTQIDRGAWEITGNFFLNIGFYNGYGRCTTPMSVSAVWLADASTNFDVSNNVIVNTKWAGILCDGYGGKGAQEGIVNITGNRVHNTIDAGIQIGMNSNSGVFYYPTNAIISNNTITKANTTSKIGIGGITILQSVCRGISITNNSVSTSFNGLTICIAGWNNSVGTRLINNNNFFNLTGGYGVSHIAGISPNGLFGTADDLANYNFENNYWGAASGPTYTTNPSGTGVGLFKETTLRGTSPTPSGIIYSTNDFDFSPFSASANTVTSVAIPCDGAADYFRSKNTTSTWETLGDWESSYNNVDFKNASLIPTSAATSVAIQSGHTVSLSSADASVGELSLAGTINLNTRLLSLKGSISGSGTINATNGTAEFRGSAAQTIPANLFTSNTVKNLTIHNTAAVTPTTTLAGTLYVTGLLTASLGTFSTGGFLTLKSTSITNTAIVGNSAGTISGNVTVERFIPARRAYRLIAPGVSTTGTIKDNWQEGQNNTTTGSNSNTNNGFGTHITGSTNGSNGFDATVNGNPSLFTFSNTSANTWTQAANTNTATLNALTPYRLFVRGSRSINLNNNSATADNTILRASGTLNNASSVVFNSASTPTALNTTSTVNQNFSLVANPYWAPINWATVTKTNIGATYYIWDPTMSTRGAYTSWNGSVGSAGSINQYIQPGQAFFITSTSSSPSLTIQQTDKSTSSSNLTTTFRTTHQDFAKLTISLNYTNNNGDLINADGATAIFGDFKKEIDNNEEAYKLGNPDEMLSINRNGTFLSIEARPVPVFYNDTLPLNLTQLAQSKYDLEIKGNNFMYAGKSGYVVDQFLNKSYDLNLDGSTTIPVVITTDPASKAVNRFFIVLGKSILPNQSATSLFVLSPNPAKNNVQVKYYQSQLFNTSITVTDINGKRVLNINLGYVQNGTKNIDISKLSSGTYVIQYNNGVEIKTEKLMIQ